MAASGDLHTVDGAAPVRTATAAPGDGGLTGFVVRMKPMVFKGTTGFAKAVDRAAGWVHGLEFGWPGPDGRLSRLALPRGTDSVGAPAVPIVSLRTKTDNDAPAPPANTVAWNTIQSLSQASLSPYDGTWMLHPQPSAGFVSGGTAAGGIVTRLTDTGSLIGRSIAEQSLAGHDIEVGVPLSPWLAIAGSRYWWGAQDITSEVRGSRVGLKLTPIPFVEIEGGRLQDTERANGTFVSARLSIPLGLP